VLALTLWQGFDPVIAGGTEQAADRERVGAIADALRDPAFHGGQPVKVVETHGSWVFLTADRAYKLRKPVVFPFLDYGTPARRRAMCEEEVRVGRRLAPGIYLGARPIVARDGGYAIGPDGAEGIEYVVEMRRFDAGRTLQAQLERGEAGPEDVRRIARRIAAFHRDAERAHGAFSACDVMATVSENFTTLLRFADLLDRAVLAAAHRFAVAFVHARREELDRRSRDGLVRDGHGDLRAEHVILENGEVEIFDPVEFDPALRRIDVSADLAFLTMELYAAGRDDLAEILVDTYREAGGDDGGDGLLAFYACYRAWVRAKVACLRAEELAPGPERDATIGAARRLAELGGRLAWRARRPLLLVVCGLSGSGKSTLAKLLAAQSDFPVVNSDMVRKQRAGLEPTQRAPQDVYVPAVTREVYVELGREAARLARRGGGIIDATFRLPEHRRAFAEGLGDAAPAPLFVECQAPRSVLLERVRLRAQRGGSVSDATESVVERQLAEYQPMDDVPARDLLELRTDRPLDEAIAVLQAALDARLAG
jgi:aminoglycoside phosphotransferase family enzyme/predicted kinase